MGIVLDFTLWFLCVVRVFSFLNSDGGEIGALCCYAGLLNDLSQVKCIR